MNRPNRLPDHSQVAGDLLSMASLLLRHTRIKIPDIYKKILFQGENRGVPLMTGMEPGAKTYNPRNAIIIITGQAYDNTVC